MLSDVAGYLYVVVFTAHLYNACAMHMHMHSSMYVMAQSVSLSVVLY